MKLNKLIQKLKEFLKYKIIMHIKTNPIPNNKKTVVLGEIDIFFKAKVGILLTSKIAIKITVK